MTNTAFISAIHDGGAGPREPSTGYWVRPRFLIPRTFRTRAALVVVAMTAAAGVMAPSAWAASPLTLCVHQSGYTCPSGSTDEGSDLQTALDDAAGNAVSTSSPNTITLGPGTYSGGFNGFSYLSSNPLQVRGAGAGRAIVTASPSAFTVLALGSSDAAQTVSISGLEIDVVSSGGTALTLTGGTADHVAITTSQASSTGASLTGATLSASSVSSDNAFAAVTTQGEPSELDDDTIDGGDHGILAEGATTIHRVTVKETGYGVITDDAPVSIDDSLVEAQHGLYAQDNSAEASINALNDTLVGTTGASFGVAAIANSSAGADVQILNSIIYAFPTSFDTYQQTSGDAATIEASSDNYDGLSSGSAIFRTGPVGAEPGFVDPGDGDYHLAWDSPLIDASSIANAGTSSSTTDLDGNPRVVVDGSASTPVDLGAYEYQHRAPQARAIGTPSSGTTGTVFAFDGTGSHDADDGDHLTYSWGFDDGATATGATASHAFSSAGQHSATLTVTDPSGLTSTTTAAVTVTNPNSGTGTGTLPGGGSGTPSSGSPSSGSRPTPPSPPTPPSHPAATVKLTTLGHASVTGKRISLRLACTGTAACSPIKVTATAMTHHHRVTVGTLTTHLGAGHKATLTLTLNRAGRALLATTGRLTVALTVTVRNGARTLTVETAHVRLP